MQPTTPPSNLRGFSQMTSIMSYIANKPLHTGGAVMLR